MDKATTKKIDEIRKALPERERRLVPTTEGSLALRTDGDEMRIAMFVPFNKWSHPLGAFREKIAPSAFRKTLKERSSDVVSLWNHDANWVLGRESNDTLTFRELDNGQEGVVTLDAEDPMHRHFARRVERRDVQGASFAFETVRDEWEHNAEDGAISRTLLEVKLFDWSPVTYPAYPDSDSERRSQVDVLAVRSGVDVTALAALFAAVKDGKLPVDKSIEAREWITKLEGYLPEIPNPDADLAKIAFRNRIARGAPVVLNS